MTKTTLLLVIPFVLIGCATPRPCAPTFPELPTKLMVEPKQDLEQIPEGATLSESTKVIIKNYTTAHEWRVQLKSLQEWVKEQKELTDKSKESK